jgi:hypothetical protein
MSFRSIIIAIIVTLIVAKSAVVTWVIFNATNSAVQELALGQINASLDSVAEQIESLFEPCERILFSLTDKFRAGDIPLNDPKEMATELATLLAFEKGITWINFGFADGSFAGAQSKDGKISIRVSNTQDGQAESWDITPMVRPKMSISKRHLKASTHGRVLGFKKHRLIAAWHGRSPMILWEVAGE